MDMERIDPLVAAALERFIADQAEPLTKPQAVAKIVRDWLSQNGYLDGKANGRPH